MSPQHKLWILKISAPSALAESVAQAIGKDALAVTILAPPRHEMAQVELIYDHELDIAQLDMQLTLLAASLQTDPFDFTFEPSPQLDWLKKVAQDFPPLKIARWTVFGAAHRRRVPNRLNALQIDATNAFGTGEHPTTRGCLLMLHKLLKSGFLPSKMADIGCGSGILAMGCSQATQCEAVGVDLDPASVQIASRNIRSNGLALKVRVTRGSGYAAPLIAGSAPYDLIMANIFAVPLCQMAKDLKTHLALGGVAILSGLLTTQAKKVIAAHRMQGLVLTSQMILGEWSILAFKRHNGA